jgi:hypothetical protein
MMSSPQLARSALELNPLRLSYSLLSDKNPMMRPITPLLELAQTNRTRIAAENPFVEMQQSFSRMMIELLNLYRDARDQLVEQTFHAVYGSPIVQAACGITGSDGPPRPRPGQPPSIQAAFETEVRRLKGRIAEGSSLDAAARVLVYIGKTQHRVEEHTFQALRRIVVSARMRDGSLPRFGRCAPGAQGPLASGLVWILTICVASQAEFEATANCR